MAISVNVLLVESILGLCRGLTVIAGANQSPGFASEKTLFWRRTGFWTKGAIGGCQKQTGNGIRAVATRLERTISETLWHIPSTR